MNKRVCSARFFLILFKCFHLLFNGLFHLFLLCFLFLFVYCIRTQMIRCQELICIIVSCLFFIFLLKYVDLICLQLFLFMLFTADGDGIGAGQMWGEKRNTEKLYVYFPFFCVAVVVVGIRISHNLILCE